MSRKDRLSDNRGQGSSQGKSKRGYNEPGTTPQSNVCGECHYHNSHGPSCSKNPDNQKEE